MIFFVANIFSFDKNLFKSFHTLNSIPLYAKKAKVLTNQPTDSYQLIDNNGSMILKITNPTKFWSLTNYLVIQLN